MKARRMGHEVSCSCSDCDYVRVFNEGFRGGVAASVKAVWLQRRTLGGFNTDAARVRSSVLQALDEAMVHISALTVPEKRARLESES